MGTRNLTMVKVDGKIKVAQYGQWDGYPTGQGVTVAEFVQAYLVEPTLRAEFAETVRKVKKGTKRQLDQMNADWRALDAEIAECDKAGEYAPRYRLDFFKWYNRDTGAQILKMIFNDSEPPPLHVDVAFLKDTLFCEWAYCVNLDTDCVDVYMGAAKPAISVPFAKFTVLAMRTLRADIDATEPPETVLSILKTEVA